MLSPLPESSWYGTAIGLTRDGEDRVTSFFHWMMLQSLKESVIAAAAGFGHRIDRRSGDRADVPIHFQFLDLLLRVAEDPETGLGEYAQGVKAGPGTRMPRLPALFKPKKKWRLASQVDPLAYLEHAPDKEGVCRRNYSTLQAYEEQVLEVMCDQASRGLIIVLTENEAKDRYPDLVIASLGATLQAFEEQVLGVMYDQASRGQIIVLKEEEGKDRYPDLVIASLGAQRKEKPGGKGFCTLFVRRNARPLRQY